MPIVLVSKARPQKCDALPVFRQARRIFLGYPLCLGSYDPKALRRCLVNPLTCPDEQWHQAVEQYGYWKRMLSRYRNIIHEVERERESGALAMIPRPSEGAAYVARITGPFEIVDAPSWGQDLLNLRRRMGLDCDDAEYHYVTDVAQGWPLDAYRRIDLWSLPGWLRRTTMGREAVRVLPPHPLDQTVTAYAVLDRILKGEATRPPEWTLELEEIRRRLVDVLNPYSFENLVVSLLQLEYPGEIWRHTGGPGDDGVDGVGSNREGETVGLLQVKFSADRAPEFPSVSGNEHVRRYVAVLLPPSPRYPVDGAAHLNLDWVARGVQEHWERLPLARTMRVGRGQLRQ